MRRIKLNRPPPVSSEPVKENVSDNTLADNRSSRTQDVLTPSQTGDVSALGISADDEKCPSHVRLITRKDAVTVEEDTRSSVEDRHTVVRDTNKEHGSAASANVLQSLSDVPVASDFAAKVSEKKKQSNAGTRVGTVQVSSSGNDDTQSSHAELHFFAGTDGTNRNIQKTVSGTRRSSSSKKSKTTSDKTSAELFPSESAYDVSSKENSDSSFRVSSRLLQLSQETVTTVTHVGHQQRNLEVDQKLSGSLLDDVLKGFLVRKLAAIESERKVADVNRKDESVEAVAQNETDPKDSSLSSKSRRRKRSRDNDEQRRDLDCVPAKLSDRPKTLHHRDVEYTESRHDASHVKSHLHVDNWPRQGHRHLPPHRVTGYPDAEDATRHATNVIREDESVEAVAQNETGPQDSALSSKSRRKRSRDNDEQRRDLDSLPAKLRDIPKILHHHDVEYTESRHDASHVKSHLHVDNWPRQGHRHLPPHHMTGYPDAEDAARHATNVNREDESVEAMAQNETSPKDSSLSSKSRRRTHSRENDEQRRDLDSLPAKLRDRPKILHHHSVEYTESRHDTGHVKSHLHVDNWPRQGHRHLPPHHVTGYPDAEDATRHAFRAEVSSFRRGYKQYYMPPVRHSLHARRHMLSLEKKTRQTEHVHQLYDLPQLQRSQPNEQKTFDCIEQIRQFVSQSAQNFSHNVGQDSAPLDAYCENIAPETRGRERQKSGNSGCHHHHHHHRHSKKRNTVKCTSVKKMHRHKSVKHRSGKKSIPSARNVQPKKMRPPKTVKRRSDKKSMLSTTNVQQDMLAGEKHEKHKHKHHHSKIILPDVHADCKKPDTDTTMHHEETEDEDDALNERRSLSPLGVYKKHRKKHKKKKSSTKTESQISAQEAPLLPEKSDTRLDKISSDEDFVHMKVQKNEEDDAVPSNALHKMDPLNTGDTSDVKQSRTGSKSAVGHQYKFLKISGKRPKARTLVSAANPPTEVSLCSEDVPSSNILVEEHPVQATVVGLQAVKDTAVDCATAEETAASFVAVGQHSANQTGTSHEVAALQSSNASEPDNSCGDADERRALQTTTVNADQVSDKVGDERHSCSTEEVDVAAQKCTTAAIDNDDYTRSDSGLELRETEHGETVKETKESAGEQSAQEDSVASIKMVSSDNISSAVSGEELKSYSAESAHKSESDGSEPVAAFHSDVEPAAAREMTFTKELAKDTEKIESEELGVVSEEGEKSADPRSVSPVKHSLLQLNQSSDTEALATSGEVSNAVKTDTTTENAPSCVTNHKVDENRTAAPSTLMGPPLVLPPSVAFKKPLPLKMNLRITNTSTDIITSGGRKVDGKGQSDENREEGN